jgi:hypothetical protein
VPDSGSTPVWRYRDIAGHRKFFPDDPNTPSCPPYVAGHAADGSVVIEDHCMIPAVLRHTGVFARILTLACAVTAAGTAAGQSTSAPAAAPSTAPKAAPSPFGGIVGIVVDSLHGRPLSGAQISVEGLNTLAMTDSAGRFRVDSVPPGKYRIGIFHPLLDSLGLSIASPQLKVSADSILEVIFSTPSSATFIRLVCGDIQMDTMNGVGPSVVVGRVLDAETEAPVAGIKVTLSWTDIQAGVKIGVHRVQRERDTTTTPSGEFRFCHLPPNLNGVVRAATAKGDSGDVSRPVSLNGRLVVPLVLHVPGTAKPATNKPQGTASSGRSSAPSTGGVPTGSLMRPDDTNPPQARSARDAEDAADMSTGQQLGALLTIAARNTTTP